MLSSCLFLTSSLAVAQATGAETASALVDQGVALRREGRDADAVVLFRQAFALNASGRNEAQLALGLLATGEFVSAYDHLEHALTSDEEWITRNHTALRSSLEAAGEHVGMLEITGDQIGAGVNVNGERVGQLPLAAPIRVQTGRAIVDVTQEGFRSFSAEVTVHAGQTSRVSVHLVPNLAPDAIPGPDVTREDWFWPLIVGTGVALAVGVTLTVLAVRFDGLPYEQGDIVPHVTTLEFRP